MTDPTAQTGTHTNTQTDTEPSGELNTDAIVEVTVLTQPDCAFCEHADAVLARVSHDHPLRVRHLALASQQGRDLATRHGVLFAPGVLLEGKLLSYGRLSERRLRRELARRELARQEIVGRKRR